MALAIGTKVDLAFAQKGSTVEDHKAGIITDVRLDKADGANGPIGQCYEIIVHEVARPENGGQDYLRRRMVLTSSWALKVRKYADEFVDQYPTVEDLVEAEMESRQAAHIRRIQSQAATVAETLDAVPF